MKRLLVLVMLLGGRTVTAQVPAVEIGVIYYQEGSGFKPLTKVAAKVSGRTTISGQIPGANSTLRLPAGQSTVFRVCGVDPTRYKLYAMKSTKNARTLAITKVGILGGAKSVLSNSEIAVTILAADSNCFSLTPKESLDRGEYGFSPVDSNDVFEFGIGSIRNSKSQ